MTTTPAAHRTVRVRLTAKVGGESGVGYSAVALVTLLWGCGPLLVRAIDASPLTIAFWRNWVAVPIALLIAWIAGSPLNRRWLRAAIPGGIVFAAAQTLGFASFQETSLANAVMIGAISPIVIVVVAVPMFGERLSRGQIALMAVAVAGVAVFVLDSSSSSGASRLGDMFAVLSLAAQTGYLLGIKHQRMAGAPAGAYVAGVFLVAAVLVSPVAMIWGSSFTALTRQDWVWLLLFAVFVGCFGHAMMTWAQKHVNIGVASVMILGTTVVTAVGGWIFFDQSLTPVQIAGGIAVLLSISGVLWLQIRSNQDEIILPELSEPPFAE